MNVFELMILVWECETDLECVSLTLNAWELPFVAYCELKELFWAH